MAGKAKDASKKVTKAKSSKKVESKPVEPEPVVESVPETVPESTELSTEAVQDEFEVLMATILHRHEVIEKEQKLLRAETKRLCKVFKL